MQRTILHADLDAFYASVEQLDDPALRGRPVVVGGSPESRGVVAAASYEARAFGVRSAMPMSRAVRLCPDAVRVPPRFDRYGQMSRVVMGLFRTLTPLVEPLSLDEAFLDITVIASDAEGAERVAARLKRQVKAATGLTLSVGGGGNKTVAKIASDLRKPDGLLIVPHGEEAAFLAPLPIRALWGIGPKTEQGLVRAGIHTIGDLAHRNDSDARRLLGSRGEFVVAMARGIDDRPVETEYERKSIGAETTFARDLSDGPELREALHRIAVEVAARMQRSNVAAHTVALKLRYASFKTITRQSSQKSPVSSAPVIEAVATLLFEAAARDGDRFRLLGIQCSKLAEGAVQGILLPAVVVGAEPARAPLPSPEEVG
ncbi:MAG TPA: DNA polymerase IV [Dehalococcoidia bacterium]|jgi:DNA polymerase-4